MEYKKYIMTEVDLNEARINYIPPIRILNISDEDKLTMTSIYFEARGCGRYLGHPKQPIQDFVGTPMDFYFPVTF